MVNGPMERSVDDVLAAFPDAAIDGDNLAFYAGLLEHRYLVNHCGACGRWSVPLRPLCPACWSEDVAPAPISGRGTCELTVVLHQPGSVDVPGADWSTPVPLVSAAIVEQPGLRVTLRLRGRDPGDVTLAMPVRMAWETVGSAELPFFEPDPDGRT